jgi:hypothetical protein
MNSGEFAKPHAKLTLALRLLLADCGRTCLAACSQKVGVTGPFHHSNARVLFARTREWVKPICLQSSLGNNFFSRDRPQRRPTGFGEEYRLMDYL